jgi:hypothetical protein
VGFLFVDWGRSVRQLASDSMDDEETAVCCSPVRSMDLLHISDVLLMGFPKIEVSSSIRDSATSFILGLLLHCGRWRSSRLRQQSLMMVEATRSTSNSCTCNFNFLQRCPCRGLDVKTPLCY